jgi:hypothetical protein
MTDEPIFYCRNMGKVGKDETAITMLLLFWGNLQKRYLTSNMSDTLQT